MKADEVGESEKRAQDFSAKQDQFIKSRGKLLKRNPRML